jgi:hypothetical protein
MELGADVSIRLTWPHLGFKGLSKKGDLAAVAGLLSTTRVLFGQESYHDKLFRQQIPAGENHRIFSYCELPLHSTTYPVTGIPGLLGCNHPEG